MPDQAPDIRPDLAAERTFLAWIRTGLAMLGFGFVVARSGLFLKQFQIIANRPDDHAVGPSVLLGTGLILLGVLVIILAAVRYIRILDELRVGRMRRPGYKLGVATAIALVIIGIAMAVYLPMTS